MKKRIIFAAIFLGFFLWFCFAQEARAMCPAYCNMPGICNLELECVDNCPPDPDCGTEGATCSIDSCSPLGVQDYCCNSWGGCSPNLGQNCNSVKIWDYCHDPTCQVVVLPPFGKCDWSWSFQNCASVDSCLNEGPYLRSGNCGAGIGTCDSSGCMYGGIYKTCCQVSGGSFTGNLGGNCTGGCRSGYCPGGSSPVICGVGSCAGIFGACTTAACGLPACQAMNSGGGEVATPIPTSISNPPPPATGTTKCGEDTACCSTYVCGRIEYYDHYDPNHNCCNGWNSVLPWQVNCGRRAPAKPTLVGPANGTVVDAGGNITFQWSKYAGGELMAPLPPNVIPDVPGNTCLAVPNGTSPTSCNDVGGHPSSGCWGYNCARQCYGVSLDMRKYEVMVTRRPDVANPWGKNPLDWGAAMFTVTGNATLMANEAGYTATPDSETLSVGSLSLPGTYYWFIRANVWGAYNDSDIRSFVVRDCSVPPGQASCQSPKGPIPDTTASLVWTGPADWGAGCSGNHSYEVYLDETSPPASWNGTPAAESPLPVSGLESGSTYYWSVKAVNGSVFTYGPICSFTVTPPQPWWQSQDGDIQGNNVSNSAQPSGESLSEDGLGGSPGVVGYGSGLDVGDGSLSSKDWQANDSPNLPFSYTSLFNQLGAKSTALTCSSPPCIIPPTSTVPTIWSYTGNLRLGVRPVFNTEKIILFVNGDVSLEKIVPANLTVASGGFFAIIASGKITFSKDLTLAEGFYLADGTIEILSNGSETDSQFAGNGSFVGKGGIVMGRDLGSVQNVNPAEYFSPRWDFYFNAPKEFLTTPFLFKEIAP